MATTRCTPDHNPLGKWKADHLYLDDDGRTVCGAHMGVESTYKPHAFDDLGVMDAAGIARSSDGAQDYAFCCEASPARFVPTGGAA